MSPTRSGRYGYRARWPAVALFALTAWTGAAQEADPPPESLRADVVAVRPMFTTDREIRLRFTLINTSDEPVTLPGAGGATAKEGTALPLAFVLGIDQPLLSVIYEDEAPKPVPVIPPTDENPGAPASPPLRLAPRGVLGLELDLTAYHAACRYPGVYRVEWRALDGRVPAATATFRVESRRDAILVTDYGKVSFELDYERAPLNVANFLELARDGFYEGKVLHRIIPGFVIQGGCPKGDGTGIRPDGRRVPAEFHPEIPVEAGTLLMARKPRDPNSASCQFFIALARLPNLDGQATVLGFAGDDESLRTLQKLAAVPCDANYRPLAPVTIRSINLVDAEQNRARRLELRRPAEPSSPRPPPTAEPVAAPQPTPAP